MFNSIYKQGDLVFIPANTYYYKKGSLIFRLDKTKVPFIGIFFCSITLENGKVIDEKYNNIYTNYNLDLIVNDHMCLTLYKNELIAIKERDIYPLEEEKEKLELCQTK